MVQVTKCDKCDKLIDTAKSYQCKVYNRSTKVSIFVDLCHECFILGVLTVHTNTIEGSSQFYAKLATIHPKWQQWDKDNKRWKDAS